MDRDRTETRQGADKMEAYIDSSAKGDRPFIAFTEEEYERLSLSAPVSISGKRFFFSHWTKHDLDRIYITVHERGRKFTGTYAHRFYSYNVGATLCSLQADYMDRKYAQAFIDAIQEAISD